MARFCTGCGAAFKPADPAVSNPSEQAAAEPVPVGVREDVQREAAGKVSPAVLTEIKPANRLDQTVRPVSTDPVSNVRSTSLGGSTDFRFGQPEITCPIRLSFCFNRVMVADTSSVFKMRVENTSQKSLSDVRVEFSVEGLKGEPIVKTHDRLPPNTKNETLVTLIPKGIGCTVLEYRLTVRYGAMQLSFKGQRELLFMEKPSNPDVHINIGDIKINSGDGANGGLGSDVVLTQNFGSAKSVSVTELMSKELTTEFYSHRLEPVNQFIMPPRFGQSGEQGKVLKLWPQSTGGKGYILVSRDQFTIGRNHKVVDYTVRCEDDSVKTKMVSKIHAEARLLPQGDLQICDVSTNGIRISAHAERELEPKKWEKVIGGEVLTLGKVYDLKLVQTQTAFSGVPSVVNIHQWHGSRPDPVRKTGAMRFDPISYKNTDKEVLWLFSEASFGSEQDNAIVLDSRVARHQGYFFYFSNCFWVANHDDKQEVELDGYLLREREIVPLGNGQVLRIGKTSFSVFVSETI